MRKGIRMKLFLASVLALVASTSALALPATVRVRLETSAGTITLALDAKRAPRTTANFLAYVDDGRLDGTSFYRASRVTTRPGEGLIQGGIGTDVRRKLLPVPFESTQQTGLSHTDGAISMARGTATDLANCNFSIMAGDRRYLDARDGSPGYAVFGRVVGGMAVVKRILAMPTGGGSGAMRGQMILRPVTINRAVRLDGTPKPTGLPKTWLIPLPKPRDR
jgi:peptidyl-prolyl cis-trans isomerase A (cyclophilin A)